MTDNWKPSQGMVLLLTATVDPGATISVERRNPALRLEDYKNALKLWLLNPATPSMIFCENSQHDLTQICQIIDQYNQFNKKVEVLSFGGQNYPPNLGKGYGEMKILAHAMEHADLIDSDTRVIKVTGRYYVRNATRIFKSIIEDREPQIFCDLRGNLSWSLSQVFCGTRNFIERYLLPLQETLDDSIGTQFETVLARATHLAIAEGYKWSMLPEVPDIDGIRGTDNRPLRRPKWRWMRAEVAHYLQRRLEQW